jgi:hypothetical protein
MKRMDDRPPDDLGFDVGGGHRQSTPGQMALERGLSCWPLLPSSPAT